MRLLATALVVDVSLSSAFFSLAWAASSSWAATELARSAAAAAFCAFSSTVRAAGSLFWVVCSAV